MFGFVTGATYGIGPKGDQLADTDIDGMTGWVAKYCLDHPLDNFVQAAIGLVEELLRRR